MRRVRASDDDVPLGQGIDDATTAEPSTRRFVWLASVSMVMLSACGSGAAGSDASGQLSKIEHVVLIVQENHTFDSYFGRYCQAPSDSNPACTDGPNCCEAAPDHDPSGASPILLDDNSNFATDRDHRRECELQQIDNGKMDRFVTGATGADTCLGSGPDCSSANNWALAMSPTVGPYWSLAQKSALADRYFQPTAGGTASNDMYFAVAQYQFTDNDQFPNAIGSPTAACKALATAERHNRTPGD